MTILKQALYNACKQTIRQRIIRLQESIQEAQQSANEETKSSAGDKYETGRAMAQLEIEKFASQLVELNKQDQELSRINPALRESHITLGSLVHTDNGSFFIAVNTGEMSVDGKKIFTISPQAPIAKKMLGLNLQDSFVLNGRSFTIMFIE